MVFLLVINAWRVLEMGLIALGVNLAVASIKYIFPFSLQLEAVLSCGGPGQCAIQFISIPKQG
jgi:hypothetical protein